MQRDEFKRRSRWIMRAMEWDEPRARYPNLWQEGMPRHLLAFDRVASRLRLGDLIAIYYPTATKHADRSNRFVGLARVAGLRRAEMDEHAWIDLETAHVFGQPLDLGRTPRRVFLCCDPGWPEPDVALFQSVFDTAVATGWRPSDDERAETAPRAAPESRAAKLPGPAEKVTAPVETVEDAPEQSEPGIVGLVAPEDAATSERLFAGADYSGDMRDPRHGTWLAVVALHGDRLRAIRLEATGRSGLEAALRNPDRHLMRAEAIGLGFPFGLPQSFAETILGGSFPDEGWWALAKQLERVSWPDYLTRLQDFREQHGEIKRVTDERAGAGSPLHRVEPDLGSRTYHGVRMIAADRSRYAVRPFESAQGHLVFEVWPDGVVHRLGLPGADGPRILDALAAASPMPLDVPASLRSVSLGRRDALDALIAARSAALAVTSGEVECTPDELAPEHADRVRREGWIYGLGEART